MIVLSPRELTDGHGCIIFPWIRGGFQAKLRRRPEERFFVDGESGEAVKRQGDLELIWLGALAFWPFGFPGCFDPPPALWVGGFSLSAILLQMTALHRTRYAESG